MTQLILLLIKTNEQVDKKTILHSQNSYINTGEMDCDWVNNIPFSSSLGFFLASLLSQMY